jgi:hypothetical protein
MIHLMNQFKIKPKINFLDEYQKNTFNFLLKNVEDIKKTQKIKISDLKKALKVEKANYFEIAVFLTQSTATLAQKTGILNGINVKLFKKITLKYKNSDEEYDGFIIYKFNPKIIE